MLRRSFRLGLRLGLLIGVVAAVAKLIQSRRAKTDAGGGWTAPDTAWTPPPAPPRVAPVAPAVTPAVAPAAPAVAPTPTPAAAPTPAPPASPAEKAPAKKAPAKKAVAKKAAAKPAVLWVEPTGATCPPSHPVKAKLTSRLFQVPGMFAYERTRPDRCYLDEDTAAADGFTRAKR